MLLNQQVVGGIAEWHDQGHEKQDNNNCRSETFLGVDVHRSSVLTHCS